MKVLHISVGCMGCMVIAHVCAIKKLPGRLSFKDDLGYFFQALYL